MCAKFIIIAFEHSSASFACDLEKSGCTQRANLHHHECFCINFVVEIIPYFMWKNWNGVVDNISHVVDAPECHKLQ